MTRMKKGLLFVLLVSCFATVMQAVVISKKEMSPAQLKDQLLKKYGGRMNGIENLARVTSEIEDVANATFTRQKIEIAVNQFAGMGSIDIDAVEKGIENAIHQSLMAIFNKSIDLASKTHRHEASDNLFAIAPWNKKVIWNTEKTHVLMLTWIPSAYSATYQKFLDSGEDMKIAWDAWVTAVPEVKEFAQNYVKSNKNGFNLTDRIEQFLGLIPSKPPYAISQNKLFVEMWVRPEDLFRPCLDAEIIDTECVIDPHESDMSDLPPAFRDMSKLIPMSSDHKKWFDKEKKGKYSGQWAMPWTRFGYTYDWGSSKKIEGKRAAQGASEYLIKSGSNVKIHSIIPTDEYPSATTPKSGYVYQE